MLDPHLEKKQKTLVDDISWKRIVVHQDLENSLTFSS